MSLAKKVENLKFDQRAVIKFFTKLEKNATEIETERQRVCKEIVCKYDIYYFLTVHNLISASTNVESTMPDKSSELFTKSVVICLRSCATTEICSVQNFLHDFWLLHDNAPVDTAVVARRL